MTSRDQARRRFGNHGPDLRPDAGPVAAGGDPDRSSESLLSLPDRLLAARERKGVDLYRAERDTKIRSRYLAALERGDYRELPGAVYTKGFLRNYALYLGLDPEDILLQWRQERGDVAQAEPVITVPRPLSAPRQGLTFSPGVVVAALLTVAVVAFVAYLGVQLLRFAKPPTVSVSDPPAAVSEVDETTTQYTFRGTSLPGATIEITTPGRDEPYRVTAQSDGSWSVAVELRRGRNEFDVSAKDPDTGKTSEASVKRFITVPFLVIQAPTLTVDQPTDGATYQNGAIPVQGTTTNAAHVVVSAAYLGPAAGSSGPAPAGGPSPAAPSPPAASTVTPADDGTFGTPLELSAGRWSITVTASSAEAKTVAITRTVTVNYTGVNLVITIKGDRAWLKVWVDDQVSPVTGQAGKVYSDGNVLTFTAQRTIEVRTGKASATSFTLNGTNLGTLGDQPNPATWLFAPPNPPQQTGRR